MLGKLIKHEFRATSRVMLPLFLAELVMALLAALSSWVLENSSIRLLQALGGLMTFLFGVAVAGVSIMAIVLMVQRFYKNLLGDEGYLMFTLPANVHQIVWSKLIVSSVWIIVTAIVDTISIIIASCNYVSFSGDGITWGEIVEMFSRLNATYAINGAAFLIEGLVIIFLGCVAVCLLFYAAMAVGHGFPSHKVLLSVVFFFVFQFVTQIAGVVGIMFSVTNITPSVNASALAEAHGLMLIVIAVEALYCAAFYFITTLNLQKRLNLE